jgi:hypothetical protein
LEKKIHWIPDGQKKDTSSAQYVTLQKFFSRPSLVIDYFATPAVKLKRGQQIGGGLPA